jgi:NagD protein
MIHQASQLIVQGARFIATNPDVAGPDGQPACGALCAQIERISGKTPFYIGKPNPYLLRAALNRLNAHTEQTIIIGDNIQTDILAGIQAGIDTILVLTGVHQENDLTQYPYQPNYVFPDVSVTDVI